MATVNTRSFNQTVWPTAALIAPWLLSFWIGMVFFGDFVWGGFNVSRCAPEQWAATIFWWYITVQAAGALFRPPHSTGQMVGDVILSLVPAIVCAVAFYAWYAGSIQMSEYKWSVWKSTLRFVFTDVVIFSWFMAKINYYADPTIITNSPP